MLLARIVLVLFGVFLLGGGIMGFVKADSKASLIAGCVFGGLMLFEAWLSLKRPASAFYVAALLTLILTARFGYALYKLGEWKLMPNGLGVIVSPIVLIVLLVAATQAGKAKSASGS